MEATFAALCVGNCNDDKKIAVNELITGVNIALGLPPAGGPRRRSQGPGRAWDVEQRLDEGQILHVSILP